MLYKRLIAFIAVVLTAICFYSLTFTWKTFQVEEKATLHATLENGAVDFEKKRSYLEDRWKDVVYTVPIVGKKHTYEEVKQRSIELGLDLQHGMDITMEIAAFDLIRYLAGPSAKTEAFKKVLKEARAAYQKDPRKLPTEHFYEQYKEHYTPKLPLRKIFMVHESPDSSLSRASDKEVLAYINEQIKSETQHALKVFAQRLDSFGTSNVNFSLAPRPGTIQVQVQGLASKKFRPLLEKSAQLGFYPVMNNAGEVKRVHKIIKSKNKTLGRLLMPVQGRFFCKKEDLKKLTPYLKREVLEDILPGDYTLFRASNSGSKSEYVEIYLVCLHYKINVTNFEEILKGNVIKKASYSFLEGGYQVQMTMDAKGAYRWSEITEFHSKTKDQNHIAMVVDDLVVSAPRISEKINDRNSVIRGNFTAEEAKVLANLLESGSLSTHFEITGETITGPTLGKAAQQQAFWAIVIALLLIILFMVLYYALGGLVASIALLFNMLFILGTLAQLNAVLTLPGIAGILLTFGMSVDANVLVFERIREELRSGVYIKTAIAEGYNRAYSSIIDSNVTTLLIGIILYLIGQGPIKGFATTLIIGIISSLFTAVLLTRLIMEFIGYQRMSFSFGFTKNLLTGFNIDFLRIHRWAYLISFVIMAAGMVCVWQKGLKKSVEFTGGRSIVAEFDSKVDLGEVKGAISDAFGGASVEVQTYGKDNVLKITTNYKTDDNTAQGDSEVRLLLANTLAQITSKEFVETPLGGLGKNSFTIASSTRIGAIIASDMTRAAQWAIILALLMIFAYILIRFRRATFGLAAVIALMHDVLMVFSAMGIARLFGISYEIDQVFISAVLTVIGYSINDTVVIFDRLRELGNINESINKSMSRTWITSFTTFLAVITLFIFAGEALRGLSFTLMIGIIFGTYSSIFATPVAHDLDKAVQRVFKKRKKTLS